MNIKYQLLIAAALSYTQIAVAQSPTYKCVVDGKTVSSVSPCKVGATQQTGPIKSPRSKKYVCEAAKQDLANLDSMATEVNSSSVQDQVKQRKAAVNKIVYEWGC